MCSNLKAGKLGMFLNALTVRSARFAFLLLLFFILLPATASRVQAATVMCSQFGGVVDGSDPATYAIIQSASSFGIDMNCTVKNFPQSIGGFPIVNINFNFPQHASYYIVFQNVYYYGNMSCNDPTQSNFWIYWAPGGFNNISAKCQDFMVPVDAVRKNNPPAQTTATIGVPFTYTVTVPLLGMLDAAGTFNYIGNADTADIKNVVITDDLTRTGAALSYVSNTAFLVNPSTGTRTPLNGGLPLTLGASGTWLANHPGVLSDPTKHLVFSFENNAALTLVPAGNNIEIDLTVVLDNSPANAAGMQFTNVANTWFDKTINSTNIVDLQAWPGTTPPMTIVEPNLQVTKTSTATNLNVGTPATFRVNVQNAGGTDAWNTTITDNIPAGMCIYDPRPTVTAQIFAADGVTPVSGPLVNGTDFSLAWNGGTASACQMSLTMLTPAAKIGPTQRLIISYTDMLDAGTPSGTFTNVAGATRWFDAAATFAGRREYDMTLTNGTPGVLDFQDAYTITAAVAGYYFLKSVDDLTTGASPAIAVFPGDRLRYTLQIQNFNIPPLNNVAVNDDLGALNGFTAFVPGSLSLAGTNLPAGTYSICSTCGTNGAGTVTITGLSLGSNVQYQIQFDVTLASNLTNGTVVRNQGSLAGTDSGNKAWSGVSDDPSINGPALLGTTGDPTPVLIQAPGAISKANVQSTATIGQQFSYLVTVPSAPANVPLYDVRVLDNLGLSGANLSFVSAQVVSGGAWNLVNTGSATNLVIQDANTGIDIPAGGQAVIRITVALQNTTANHSGVTFTNTASYTYDRVNGDSSTQVTGGAGVTSSMTVVEPVLTVTKTVSYAQPAGKPATAPASPGDVLQYTVTVPNSGTSEAFDVDVMDTLASNVSLVPGSATARINGVPVSGFLATPATLPTGALVWGSRNGDDSLDIPVSQSLVLTYQVTVMETNGTPIANSVYVDWTSLSGVVMGERTGAGCPAWVSPNNYCTGPASAAVSSLDPTALAKAVVSDSWNPANDSTLRVGDTVVYSLALTLREGVTQNVVVTDQLPAGLAFAGVVSINGDVSSPYTSAAPFTYANFTAPTVNGQTVTWNFGDVTNAVDNNPNNNILLILYRARVVKNTLAQTPTAQALTNGAALNYAVNGVAAGPKTSGASINVWQPMLTVSKSASPAGGGTVISANEFITYTVRINNTGASPAYDTVLTDTLPVGLRQNGVNTTSITLVNTATSAVIATLPILVPSYNPVTGVATWNSDAPGSPDLYAIPPGDTLQVVYQVRADASLGAGMTLNNLAQVTHYYSFDSQDIPANSLVTDRQDYGATNTATFQLFTAAATALAKRNLVTTAAVGQPFTYSITVPATPQPAAMYDVRIQDNLSFAATGVDMSFVSVQRVSGPAFTPVNTGTATNLVIEDTTTGIDIPAGEQIVINITVVLNDTANNTVGKQFQNTATYTYDSVNNDKTSVANGAPGASGAITIIGPNLTLTKGGPGTMRAGVPGSFTLNVQNTGAGTAWNTTLTDVLPNVTIPAPGGMCNAAPTGVTARIYQADGVTPVSAPLVSGTDFTISFAGAPVCTWTVSFKSPAAAIPPTDRLIVTYSASLDPGSASNLALTNVAGATQYQSADPNAPGAAGNVRTTTNTLTNGTPGTLDYQDAFTVTTESPVLAFTKTVFDMTTGQSGATARPGDTLRYTLTVQNVSTLSAANFSLTDELDKLNATALFVPGSLSLVSVPAGANTASTSATGGAKGTGFVSISNLNIAPQGQPGDTLVIQFQAALVPVINSSTVVLDQAQLGSSTLPTQLSDDPSLPGTSDPTRTVIASAPAFQVLKTVRDITSGTPTVMAGDILLYTITVKNRGTENAAGVTLHDQIPPYTAYVASSTRLNGAPVADPSGGVSALQNGMLINSPANLTAGAMPANAGATTTNVATITFQVQISRNVVNGTLISNQGFVDGSGAATGPFPEQPSDNPATPVPNDPTTVVVGSVPLVYALKTVQLAVDNNGNGLADPGDVLQYTITLTNSGPTPATGVVLADSVPANTTYVANSVVMNGSPVGQPDGGVSPLVAGIGVVSSGLTPPSPPSSGGTLAAGGTGVVTFRVQINAGVPSGTIISNQGSVATAQLPALPTDADGNPTNGYQPTVIAVGNAQQLSITKAVLVVGGGPALPGSVLEYTIQVNNVGLVPATNVVITDDLTPLAAQAAYVANSATMNGSTNGVNVAGPLLTATYSATYGPLAPGGSIVVRFDVKLNGTVTGGTAVTNTGQASWNIPAQTATASASVVVGGMPGSASLSGTVWQDTNYNITPDSGEPTFSGWAVELYKSGQLLGTVSTASDGSYRIDGVSPNAGTTIQYELRFRAPGAGSNTAKLGWASSPATYGFTNGMQLISNIVTASNDVLRDLNLPLTPNGVVYNSVTRAPIAGATLSLVRVVNAGTTPPQTTPLAASCFNDPAEQNQVTLSRGYYKFDLNFNSDPSCPSGGDYLIQVTPPASGYAAGASQLIPVPTAYRTASFPVPDCPGNALLDAVASTPNYCEAQASSLAPTTGSGAYYLHLTLAQNTALPAASQIFNNHIPLDPPLDTAIAITKTSAMVNVARGEFVPYTITLRNTLGAALQNLSVVDTFPPGFKYVAGSGRMDGQKAEPAPSPGQLSWSISQIDSNSSHVIKLLMIVGSGVSEGAYVNRAQVMNQVTRSAASAIATATVRVTADPTMDCTDIIGKVFDDKNLNGYQDEGEKGLRGVRIVSTSGLLMTTDQEGRFHLTCAVVPDENRGSNFILKLDDRTLPAGYRVTTENPLVERATRGKAMKFNFGAALHRVVRLDLADGVFEPGSTEMREQWKPRIELLLAELRKAPALLRISYLADVEDPDVVKARSEAVKREIAERWGRGSYRLIIETEIYWRRGGPPADKPLVKGNH